MSRDRFFAGWWWWGDTEQGKRDGAALSEQLKGAQAALAEQQRQHAALKADLGRVTGEYNAIKQTQAAERERLAQFDDEIQSLERHIKTRYALSPSATAPTSADAR